VGRHKRFDNLASDFLRLDPRREMPRKRVVGLSEPGGPAVRPF
jgi:hypothetical protein